MDEISKIDSRLRADNFDLILYPTEQCNFRCVYCYEDFEIGRMPDHVQHAVKRFIQFRSKSVRNLTLNWFGGEPLAARDIVLDIAKYAKDCMQESGSVLSGNVTTNGYLLTPDIAEELVSLNHKAFHLSLDGFGDVHNKTRRLAGGGPTFERIWNNLVDLSRTRLEFSVTLRLHLTRDNIPSMRELLRNLSDSFMRGDDRFDILFKIVNKLSDSSTNASLLISKDDWESSLCSMEQRARDVGLKVHARATTKVCHAARPNSIAIRANGLLQKCTVLLQSDVNNIGMLAPDGSLSVNSDKALLWMEGLLENNTKALACPAQAILTKQSQPGKVIPIEVV